MLLALPSKRVAQSSRRPAKSLTATGQKRLVAVSFFRAALADSPSFPLMGWWGLLATCERSQASRRVREADGEHCSKFHFDEVINRTSCGAEQRQDLRCSARHTIRTLTAVEPER
jgi:hypothetical protein